MRFRILPSFLTVIDHRQKRRCSSTVKVGGGFYIWPVKLPGLDTYFGGKAGPGTYQRIINTMPVMDTLVIPYAGNCGVTRHIRWPARVLVNDLDPVVTAAWATHRAPGFEVHNRPALDFLSDVLSRPDLGRVVIYADPPYPYTSRKSQRPVYRFEMGDAAAHVELLAFLRAAPAQCLVSTYPNELYRETLPDWQLTEFKSQTRHGAATEWLFYNFDPPAVLHDDRYAGGNYREREYIKRKAGRWLAKYRDFSPAERQYVLREILSGTTPELLSQLQHR